MRKLAFILCSFLLITQACSSSQEVSKEDNNQKDEIYVFDDAVVDTTYKEDPSIEERDEVNNLDTLAGQEQIIQEDENIQPNEEATAKYFIVQVGAFSTKEKAEKFVQETSNFIDFEMSINYSGDVNLFVVWLPQFKTREEAESVRDNLWTKDKFRDAFIITVQ